MWETCGIAIRRNCFFNCFHWDPIEESDDRRPQPLIEKSFEKHRSPPPTKQTKPKHLFPLIPQQFPSIFEALIAWQQLLGLRLRMLLRRQSCCKPCSSRYRPSDAWLWSFHRMCRHIWRVVWFPSSWPAYGGRHRIWYRIYRLRRPFWFSWSSLRYWFWKMGVGIVVVKSRWSFW